MDTTSREKAAYNVGQVSAEGLKLTLRILLNL